MSRAKRFDTCTNVNDNPGPGSYVSHKDVNNNSASYSKKGTGGFASKDRRIAKIELLSSPGAGSYDIEGKIFSRRDFNRSATTSNFHEPIAQKREKTDNVPAPNIYSVTDAIAKTRKVNNVSANAAFKSQTKREAIPNMKEAANNPAPWQYKVNDQSLHSSVRVPVSSFKSKTIRQMQASPDPNPGPGAYSPGEAVGYIKRTQFPRKHYLCISAPAMPLPSPLPMPGPGSYELVNYEGIPKHYMSSSVFVSNTSRWTGEIQDLSLPGPAHYKPLDMGRNKQSFIYNAQGKWI